ncbi:caspase family protein [Brevundimonas sp. A19_0]|uniref:caspase family protein n=1 Tax=Brevundimonas sp. A19_0 TaxID=2821087 RepID=UPI001ADBFB35|nr:caspase family protein [Brevundimonas sp. A19_0]MBO9501123.1 caspase family protein [Brevundimonas sp. A19_0]
MVSTLRIMGVHGLGDHRDGGKHGDWEAGWEASVRKAMPRRDVPLEFDFLNYDDLFFATGQDLGEYARSAARLLASCVASPFRRQKGVPGSKWVATVGYVVAWLEDEEFKTKVRARFLERVAEWQPDVILAHSLGSLITYNALTHPDAEQAADVLGRATYVTLGSQINNPCVVGTLAGGRLQRLKVNAWRHLYNEHDPVLTADITYRPDPNNFTRLLTPFREFLDEQGTKDGGHSARGYFEHPVTVAGLWQPLADRAAGDKSISLAQFEDQTMRVGALTKGVRSPSTKAVSTRGRRRALLVGINDYPAEKDRLEGCVNDVFAISSLLQDCGFSPDDIRTVLDRRATTEGILQRLEWLLDDAGPEDQLVFYFSGHGARIPIYDSFDQKPASFMEVLCPADFDWTEERCIADRQIQQLYSQLPYDTHLAMIFDCCHSGGMHRDGGARARGLTPPDDIRHRELKWHREEKMWVPRDFEPLVDKFARKEDQAAWVGSDSATRRLGRAVALRPMSSQTYARIRKVESEPGPYLPLIIEACAEHELSYEYRHGATSYGAFTFSFHQILREEKGALRFDELIAKVGGQLSRLNFNQNPQILGPSVRTSEKVPWLADPIPPGAGTG